MKCGSQTELAREKIAERLKFFK